MTSDLKENIKIMQEHFKDDGTFKERFIGNNMWICFVDGMINARVVNENVIAPLQRVDLSELSANDIAQNVFSACEVDYSLDYTEICESIAFGDTALFVDGLDICIVVDTKGWNARSISEPQNERNITGPREGFTEMLMGNLALVRRRLPSNAFKVEFSRTGSVCPNNVALCWVDGQVDQTTLAEARRRLKAVDLTALLDSNMVQECIRDAPNSPFKTIGTTERPDVVASKLLEGRIAIFVEGSPIALTAPHLFMELFQTSEDYYVNTVYASFQRMLRSVGFWLSICLPSLYLALACYQPELLPSELMFSIIEARQGVPFHTVSEIFGLLLIFDLLREGGARSTANVGPALSVVSSIVLGQAAIEAKLAGAPVLIVVAFAGVTSVLIPRMSGVSIVARYLLLIITGTLGIVGFTIGMLLLFIHVASIKSFGVPYLGYYYLSSQKITKDTTVRAPWNKLGMGRMFPKK